MKILTEEVAKYYQIPSLKRGHLVFTSFISLSGNILFLDEHLLRLIKGAEFLFPEQNWPDNKLKLKQHVLDIF
jgi:branched-subunit amino acid aminotransferase/4-amino-4-deoxychorismate lyase